MAKAAKRGLFDFVAFVRAVKPRSSDDVTATAMRRRRHMTPAVVTDEHVKTCHSTPLPASAQYNYRYQLHRRIQAGT